VSIAYSHLIPPFISYCSGRTPDTSTLMQNTCSSTFSKVEMTQIRDDVVFWTNGGESRGFRVYAVLDRIESPISGPGCSSSLGLFMELGTLESSLYDNYL
jgi:hypothetical protein